MSNLPGNIDPALQLAISDLQREKQSVAHPFFNRAPLASEVPEKGIVWANVGGTFRGYTKIDGVLKYWNLT